MDRSEILKLLEKVEGDRLEFKETFNDGVLKTISAFANTYGGLMVVGVNNKREVVSNKTAYLELEDLVRKEILSTEGTGKALTYVCRVMKR